MKNNALTRKLLIIFFVLLNVSCDQISKDIVRKKVNEKEAIHLIKDNFILTNVENTGAMLGCGQDFPNWLKIPLLQVIPVLVLLLLLVNILRKSNLNKWLVLSFACVIGGGIGNLIDRIAYGSVTDFFHIKIGFFKTSIFNMADVSVTFGALMILMLTLWYKKKPSLVFSNTKSNLNNLLVLYEDNHLIAINKRPGDIVQGDKTGDNPLSEVVKQFLKRKYNKPGNVYLGVAHRLDRPTSGIVLFAKTSKALPRVNKIFADKKAQKTYWAIVKNTPEKPKDTLVHWLKRNSKQNKSYAYKKEIPDSKKAVLSYEIAKRLERYVLLEIALETGRHHQIRAQLATLNCPIKGDLKYGFDRSNKNGSIHLHARKLVIPHPVKEKALVLVAPPPEDPLWNACI